MKAAIIVFSLLPLAGAAQTTMGIRAGLNVSDVVMTNFVNPDVEADLQLKLGLHGGVFVEGKVKERVGLAAELIYSNKGVKGITDIHLHYITMPLLVRYDLNGHFFAELGPEAAYLFSAKSAHGDVSSTYNNRFDLSLDGGIQFRAQNLTIGIRYGVGLFSVREPIEYQGATGLERIKYQNRVVQLTLGYSLYTLK